MAGSRRYLWFGLLALTGCNLGQRAIEDTTPEGCAECHVDITHQWQQSAHSIAWISPAFVETTRGHQAESCLPCHAPKPLLEQPPGHEPQLRDADRQYGVDCNVCHQLGCGYAGPYRNLIQAHPTVQDTARLPCSDFCGTCHLAEIEQHREQYLPSVGPGEGQSCGGCHMPAYRSRLTQDHLLSYIHPKRTVRDHSFPVWCERVSGGAVQVSDLTAVQLPGNVWEVRGTLLNRGAGHEIPSGKFGYRELLITVEAQAADGTVLDRGEISIFPGGASSLKPGRPAPVTLALVPRGSAAPVAVRLSVERVNEDRTFRYQLAESLQPLAP